MCEQEQLLCQSSLFKDITSQLDAIKQFAADEQERLGKIIDAKNEKIEDILARLANAQK